LKPDMSRRVSTHSTLLDLAISGGRVRGGQIPAGIIVEIFGPPSAGKTAIIAEVSSGAQKKNGKVLFCDPEGRLDKEYASLCGFTIKDKDYHKPDTVEEFFEIINKWKPNEDSINIIAADSLAAFTTDLEMSDAGDKMGMKRAKEFSAGFRKFCRKISDNNVILICTNQERESQGSLVTPGGKAVPYYASLRIRMYPKFKDSKIKRTRTFREDKKIEKVVGISSMCEIKKSSIDDPYRIVPVSIIFGYGIDTIRDELQWTKDVTSDRYDAITKTFSGIEKAIQHIEENNLEEELKNRTIDLWLEVEESFKISRKKKY